MYFLVIFDKNSLKNAVCFFFAQKGHQFIFDLRNVKMKYADWLVHYVFSVYLANYLHIIACAKLDSHLRFGTQMKKTSAVFHVLLLRSKNSSSYHYCSKAIFLMTGLVVMNSCHSIHLKFGLRLILQAALFGLRLIEFANRING